MSQIDRDEVVNRNPLLRVLQDRYGFKLTKQGAEWYMKCVFHADGNRPNLRVNEVKKIFFCDVCRATGSVIDFVMKHENLDFKRACESLGAKPSEEKFKPIDVSGKIPTAVYEYQDPLGNMVYQVCRFQSPNPEKASGYDKTFRQRRPDERGGWIWNMEGVERVPFRLPELVRSGEAIVNIVEGEKDAENLIALGFIATCNVGGAGKWLAGYNDYLEGREIAIWPDNDDPGKKHAQEIFESLSPRAKNIRIMAIPSPSKDVSDYIDSFGDDIPAADSIRKMLEAATPLYGGIELPVYSLAESEIKYRKQAQEASTTVLNLSRWLPTLGRDVRGIVPGELIAILASTGVGKTATLQNLAINAAPLTTLLFEYELPEELTFERFVACSTRTNTEEVFNRYATGGRIEYENGAPTGHIFVCPKSNMTCDQLEKTIVKSELKIGRRPVLVLVDYIQLVKSIGKSRYERTSDVAEQLKTIAKNTNTIIVFASQVQRPDDDKEIEVNLYSGKESGSIENSSGLVIGMWRDKNDASLLWLKVLKNTKGRPGEPIRCNFNGAQMRITERGRISEADIPRDV